ncbi:MAG: SsrA-binding protein [Microgenomates group bacterium GW2011_GWC1_37_8]|uniref:SsrA-binding protein n=1 Tax=Candidatus Woesebacteria bacterium GW2011_GWB1_38_8 TaxID=1618570 RepID=A0A0G0P8K0_9BACT|nr:MAG: SsrA-binding protein [Microgenomates group bacterium GW2011_GWC1_37_8]KKQ85616.1 MAG: SsrA-binding protein [Candidatus Woesebacteria bacterium GW2011_GWB1_38_8]
MQILNRKAKFNYFLYERLEAGISLLGGEARAVRSGKVDLSQSYVKLIDNQAFLVNANIPIEGKKDYESTRSRKLLLHKDQIVSLKTKIKSKRLTVVPVRMYNKGRLLKVEIALAKSKRKFEKKEAIKRKDIEREIEEEFKNSV